MRQRIVEVSELKPRPREQSLTPRQPRPQLAATLGELAVKKQLDRLDAKRRGRP
jgi:hypothetical protein